MSIFIPGRTVDYHELYGVEFKNGKVFEPPENFHHYLTLREKNRVKSILSRAKERAVEVLETLGKATSDLRIHGKIYIPRNSVANHDFDKKLTEYPNIEVIEV